MIYLRTGGNGTCKTLFTLEDVRKLQLESGRPVATNGRFRMKPEKLEEFGWKVIKAQEWQDEPDGTIFLFDECHNDFPVRPSSVQPLSHVTQFAEHRVRGFDFFLLTQHPGNIDAFIRKIIQSPGWHQHLKKPFGATDSTRVLQFDAVNMTCEKTGSGKHAQISTRKHPKHVYEWYTSATIYTGKVRIPKQVYVIAALVVLVPLLGWFGFMKLQGIGGQAVQAPKGVAPAGTSPGAPAPRERPVLTAAEYANSFQPRIPGLAYTAPRYDDSTKPAHAPYPAACVSMGKRCECYTQQATKLDVPEGMCKQIVAGGFFMDWDNAVKQAQAGQQPLPTPGPTSVQPQGAMVVPVAMAVENADMPATRAIAKRR